jgi:hypothetical protein
MSLVVMPISGGTLLGSDRMVLARCQVLQFELWHELVVLKPACLHAFVQYASIECSCPDRRHHALCWCTEGLAVQRA